MTNKTSATITVNDKSNWEYSVAYWAEMMDDAISCECQWFVEETAEGFSAHTGDDTTEFETIGDALAFFIDAVNDAAPYV